MSFNFGHVVFEETLKDQLKYFQGASLFGDLTVHLQQEKWKGELLEQRIPYVKRWDLHELRIKQKDNEYMRMTKQIIKIPFPKLNILILKENNIESLQEIVKLDLPQMIRVYLYSNKISSLKPIKKINWKNMQVFSINDNCIRQGRPLTQLSDPSKLCTIRLDFSNDRQQCEDIRFIFLLKGCKLSQICAKGNQRISHKNIESVLRKKFTSI